MALEVNCAACDDLRQTSPEFVVNGLTEDMCESLQNNTGLNPTLDLQNQHNDCEDLNDLNDCLIGNMEKEVSAYQICDWKTFMKNFIPNLWTMLKAMICSICGMWCWINHLSNPQEHSALYPDNPKVRFRSVRGVRLRYDPQDPKPNDAPLRIVCIGSTARVTGSLEFYSEGGNDYKMPASYTGNGEKIYWTEFFQGEWDSHGNYVKGPSVTNQYGRNSNDGNCPTGGFLLYEYEVRSCDWGFEKLYDAPLMPSHAGDFVARIATYTDGEEYPYDCGWDENTRGQIYHPSDTNKYDTLIQVRLHYMNNWGIAHENGHITPNGVAMIKPCTSSWQC